MGQIFLMVVVFGGFFVLAIGVIVLASRQRAAAMAAWQGFSQETGLAISGTYPMIAFHGQYQGATVALMHHVHHGHKGSRHYSHFVSAKIPIDAGDLHVDREGFFDMIGKAFGGQDIQLGDATFDPTFRVRSSSEHTARAVLGPQARAALLQAVQQFPNIHIANGMISVSHQHIAEAARIRPQIDALARIASAFQAQSGYAQPAYARDPNNPYG